MQPKGIFVTIFCLFSCVPWSIVRGLRTLSRNKHSNCRGFRCLPLAAATLFLPLDAGALMELGKGVILGDFSAGVEYTTNTLNRDDGRADTILRGGPALRYESRGSILQRVASLSLEAVRYLEQSENDDENLQASFGLSYPHGLSEVPYFVDLEVGVVQETEGNIYLGRIIRSTSYFTEGNGSYSIGDRLVLGAGFDYRLEEPDPTDLADRTSFSLPVSAGYRFSEELAYSLVYRYRLETGTNLGITPESDRTDHALYLRADGTILPLLRGRLSIGLQQRTFEESGEDEFSPYLAGDLSWSVSQMTRAWIRLSNDFESTLGNQSAERTRMIVVLTHRFDDFWSASTSAGYEEVSYNSDGKAENARFRDRDDTVIRFGIGAAYTFGQMATVDLEVEYRDQDSTVGIYSFDRFSIAISTTIPF